MTVDPSGRIPYLPERLQELEHLAYNLWWRWNRRARWMLRYIDPVLWSQSRHNPVALLRGVSPHRLAHCASDPDFLKLYDRTMAEFHQMLSGGETWFSRRHPEVNQGNPVAYFCAEFGLHNSLPIYSGGLGVLAGDHCKSASDLGVPFIGVGLLYSKGYFDQKLNLEGWQEDSDEHFDLSMMPVTQLTGPGGTLSVASVPCGGRQVHIGAWLLEAGRAKLFLLDSILPENHEEDRVLTYKLYSGGHEH
ncbi:MAG: glycosyltransferase family 1 protein, partial [Gemmatimonadetes bacterium]|nr:glycosyltransferase family 1 protein [Gemmatimonadota bacterium]